MHFLQGKWLIAFFKAGLLLVNVGFGSSIFSRVSILDIASFRNIFLENMLARYRGINSKGVLERPWTKWMVLRAISSTYIEMSVYRKMLKSGLSDPMYHQIG